jgi:hypothetical protein
MRLQKPQNIKKPKSWKESLRIKELHVLSSFVRNKLIDCGLLSHIRDNLAKQLEPWKRYKRTGPWDC